MAGHSHASNVKHKKNRNDKLKSELFLKLRKKIELSYDNNCKEKIFSIAREYNFPKEKVVSIIKKVEKSKQQASIFRELLYKGKYEILFYLRGNLSNDQESLLEENTKSFSLRKLHFEKAKDYFFSTYLLKIDGCENLEEMIIYSLETPVIDKIIKIERREKFVNRFEIIFSEKRALTKTIEFFTKYPNIQLESQESFNYFSPIYVDSDAFLLYFSLVKSSFSKFCNNLQVFTNVCSKKWDHSSVG